VAAYQRPARAVAVLARPRLTRTLLHGMEELVRAIYV
jgi:hypothetical protein